MYSVRVSSSSVFQVVNPDGEVSRRVDLQSRDFTCTTFDQMRLPCRHLLAVLRVENRLEDTSSFSKKTYRMHSFSAAFERKSLELIQEDNLMLTDEVSSPTCYVSAQVRTRTRRIRSGGDSGGPAYLQ